jgi:hypothetical protein
MIGGATAFAQFKQLAGQLRDLGYEVQEQDEFGEFGMYGYFCVYRYFGVLDVDFLSPGQRLLSKLEADMVMGWDGNSWHDVTADGTLEVGRSTTEVFNRCLKRLNYEIAGSLGLSPNYCLLAS